MAYLKAVEAVKSTDADKVMAHLKKTPIDDFYAKGQYKEAAHLFAQVALSKDFVEFLTLPGYDRLP